MKRGNTCVLLATLDRCGKGVQHKLTICTILLLLPVAAAFAQIRVTGTTTDGSTREKLLYIAIQIKGTTINTTSDMEGNYAIEVPDENAILVYTSVGYETLEVVVGNQTRIDVALSEDVALLDEVVVVGYGSQKKKELTGSVTGLKERDLNRGVQTSPMGMMQGRVAGLNISKPNSGDPNADYVFQLRGTSSLQGNTSPLIIIDGIPQGDLSAIPQDDIESIDILKDGSAAAIYGTRGTNGVILVTTKRGSIGKTSTSYSGYISTSSILNKLDMMSREEFLANGGNDRGYDTDWIGELTHTPIIHSHNLAITGGTNNFNYRSSLSYKDIPGIAYKTGFDELIGRFVANQTLLNEKVSIAYDATYRRYNRESSNNDNSAFKHATHYNPTAPVYDPDRDDTGGYYQLDIQNYSNPVAQIMQNDRHTKGGTFQGSARVSVNIIEALRAQVFGSVRYDDQALGTYSSREIFNTSAYGSASRRYHNRFNKTLETTIDYANEFDRHNLVALAGYSYENNSLEWFNVNNSGFDSDVFSYYDLGAGSNLLNNPTQSMMNSFVTRSDLVSFFGRVNYSFDERYLLSASVRHEASSRLGANHKWGTFPAVSAGWRISNESFMKAADFVDELKLRIGFGITGNMPEDSYKSLPMMGIVGRFYDHSSGTWAGAYGPTQNLNEDIKWEKKAEWNIGVDWIAFNNKLSVTADAYARKVTDLLYVYKVPTPPYQYPEMLANVGDATSRGLEFAVSVVPVRNEEFSWTSSVNFSFNDNRIDKFSNEHFQTEWIEKGYLNSGDLGGLENTPLLRLVPGGKVGDFYLPVFKGFTEDGQWIFEDVDDNGQFTFDNDRKIVGNAQPDFIAGWTNEISYKNFDLSFVLRSVIGNDVFNVGRMALENPNVAGNEKNMLRTALSTPLRDAGFPSDYYLEDGSFLKLDNITLNYNVPVDRIDHISALRVYVTGQNLFTITKYKGVDPEVDMVGIDNMGIERTRYFPTVRSFVLGLNVTF